MQQLASFVIGPTPGYSPGIGRLVSMMTFVRWTTLRAVEGLTIAQLDHLHDESSNSIGALLAHIASVEVAYQRITFAGRGVSSTREAEWLMATQLGDRARQEIRGKPLAHYIEGLEEVRAFTLGELAHHDDRWLDETTTFWQGRQANNYFKWFHVVEDELNHRGQIRWLRKRLPATM
jgi:uncharacterized damage-inducible protein DinB